MRLRSFVLVSICAHAHALVAGGALGKSLSNSARPIIVHVYDRNPSEVADYAIDDVSASCRNAGATAVLAAPELIGPLAREQEVHRGSFPGPVPVIADCALKELADNDDSISQFKKEGAAAVGIRYYAADWPDESTLEEALLGVISAARNSGLGAILLAEFGADGAEGGEGASALASRVGAAAALTKAEEKDGARAVGCWNGSDNELQRLRDADFGALLLKDACLGDVAKGARQVSPSFAAQIITKLVGKALSKASAEYRGSMFGTTMGGEKSSPGLESYFDRG